ncbi:retropepsin-like aspartic protease family protein [Aquimarina sp. 2304DJ70-9]|uniref:retropepsin-like aspartic protease family protein n=1 Tax=Aquimarina penaris TaxID=3231044 RepID=UPI003461AD50
MTLRKLLTQKGYHRIKLILTKTNHFEVRTILNDVEGNFIVDTGASNSCVGFEAVEKFNLFTQDSDVKAAGAGATDMLTQLSEKNSIQVGNWSSKRISLILFDLKHVNAALIAHQAEPVDGIIGADILKKGKAIIDYERKCLYLKQTTKH